jgi:hypothetical protein
MEIPSGCQHAVFLKPVLSSTVEILAPAALTTSTNDAAHAGGRTLRGK